MIKVYKTKYYALTFDKESFSVGPSTYAYIEDTDLPFTDMDGIRQQWLAELVGLA